MISDIKTNLIKSFDKSNTTPCTLAPSTLRTPISESTFAVSFSWAVRASLFTVSSFTSVSLQPPLILVCLDNRISGLQAFKDSGKFGVSVLADGQNDLSTLFAKKDTERPADLYFTGATGVPLIKGALVTLECETQAIHEAGDHQIFVGEVRAAEVGTAKDGKAALMYFRGKYGALG